MPGVTITCALIQRVEKVAEAGVSRASFGRLAAEFCSSPGLQVSDRARVVTKAEVSRFLCRQGNVECSWTGPYRKSEWLPCDRFAKLLEATWLRL